MGETPCLTTSHTYPRPLDGGPPTDVRKISMGMYRGPGSQRPPREIAVTQKYAGFAFDTGADCRNLLKNEGLKEIIMGIGPDHPDYEDLFAKAFGAGGSFAPHRRPRQKGRRQKNQQERTERSQEREPIAPDAE